MHQHSLRTWQTFLALATSWQMMVFLYLQAHSSVRPVSTQLRNCYKNAPINMLFFAENKSGPRNLPGIVARPPAKHGVRSPGDVALSSILNLQSTHEGCHVRTHANHMRCDRVALLNCKQHLLSAYAQTDLDLSTSRTRWACPSAPSPSA